MRQGAAQGERVAQLQQPICADVDTRCSRAGPPVCCKEGPRLQPANAAAWAGDRRQAQADVPAPIAAAAANTTATHRRPAVPGACCASVPAATSHGKRATASRTAAADAGCLAAALSLIHI